MSSMGGGQIEIKCAREISDNLLGIFLVTTGVVVGSENTNHCRSLTNGTFMRVISKYGRIIRRREPIRGMGDRKGEEQHRH